MTSLRSIEIIGGGLAGLSLGRALRRHGIPVTVYEAGGYPRHRVCGEFITGLDGATIEDLELGPILDGALRHEEVAWFVDAAGPRVQRLPAPARGLSRFALDARLAASFVAAGGELRPETRITDRSNRPGCVFTTGRRRARSSWIGLKLHAWNLPLTRDLELHLGADAYIGLSRVEDGAINVCGLFRQRAVSASPGLDLMLAYLDAVGLTPLASRLAAAEVKSGSFCAVAALGFDRLIARSGGLSLGDACAMIPPFTGNGMAMAFQSARIAAPALVAYARGEQSWSSACAGIERGLRRQFRLRLASAGALHPFLLRPSHQRLMAALTRTRLLPFRPLYAATH